MVFSNDRSTFLRLAALALVVGLFWAGTASPARAQDQRIAVIDVQRILTDSQAGKDALLALQKLNEDKLAEGQQLQAAIEDLRTRISEGQLSLSQERLSEMQKEYEQGLIDLKRFQDDANRELQRQQEEAFGAIETQVMPIINQVGSEQGYTLIFNKFQSGLVFASETIDITEMILERFDASMQQGS